MTTITDLAQHLLHLDPQKNIARLSFYHFLKNQRNGQRVFDLSVVEEFYRQALCFQYWQTQKGVLAETVLQDLACFPGLTGFGFDQLMDLSHTQIVAIEFFHDLEAILQKHCEKGSEKAKIRVIKVKEGQAMVVQAASSGSLKVEVYSNFCWLSQTQLKPLHPVTQLFYNSALELDPEKTQRLDVGSLLTAQFVANGQDCEGLFLRGHTFNRHQVFNGPISQVPELFFALKATERFYINPQTDPFYLELISVLEHATHVMKSRHPEALTVGQNALKKGRLAMKNIFPNDKLLLLLVTNLEYLINGAATPTKEACPKEIPKLSPLA